MNLADGIDGKGLRYDCVIGKGSLKFMLLHLSSFPFGLIHDFVVLLFVRETDAVEQ